MKKRKKAVKGLEKLMYAILIGFAVVSFWRGAWGLMDEFFFPANYLLSSAFSFVLGILILILTHEITKELM